MADLTTANSTYATGTNDTASTLVNNVSPTDAQHINGPASAIVQIETVLGSGTTLIGSKADLAERLAVSLTAAGAIDSTGAAGITNTDSRTNTDATMLTLTAPTTNTPAAGIGTSILLRAESANENPSDLVQFGGGFSDVTAGSEDSYFKVLLRVAGAALTECWRWAATGAFKGVLTHANTADRTYILPDRNTSIGAGQIFDCPTSIASGSTRSLETFSSATGNLSGIHYYDGDFTLSAGHTLTIPAGSGRLVISATNTITINGTITGVGGGYTAGPVQGAGSAGSPGTSQPGGGGGGNSGAPGGYAGGDRILNGISLGGGGAAGGTGVGGAGSGVTGGTFYVHPSFIAGCLGGATGGNGNGTTGGAGGRGGADIILVAPTVVLAATATLNTSGATGGSGAGAGDSGGGGGGAGNILIITSSYTDNGATFTMSGGAGGATGGSGAGEQGGGAGAAGVKQINIYS